MSLFYGVAPVECNSTGVSCDCSLTGSGTRSIMGLLQGWVTSDLACRQVGWKDGAMSKPYPQEFREDVVRVARNREPGVTLERVAADFRVHPASLTKWLRRTEAEDDTATRPPTVPTESVELREARKRIRMLEQENEVLRKAAAYLSQANLPTKTCTRSYASWPPPTPLRRCRWR
ncbi:transposase [Streptomyces sp. NPDC005012]|uniref:transposase n=1 Tax=Streptomyces sp. NPDC005012 TaxID=3154558 RepID=UPI0033B27BE1